MSYTVPGRNGNYNVQLTNRKVIKMNETLICVILKSKQHLVPHDNADVGLMERGRERYMT
jgi:hypothetical protein